MRRGGGDSGWGFHAAHAGVLPLDAGVMPEDCRWSGKIAKRVYFGGDIRGAVWRDGADVSACEGFWNDVFRRIWGFGWKSGI